MNNVIISGRIRSVPRVTYTQSGTPRASWILEVPRCRGQTESRDYLPCVAWGAEAEKIRDFGSVDTRLEARGEVQSFKKKDGSWELNIVCDYVTFPDRKEKILEKKE